jgi:hypothetical protein
MGIGSELDPEVAGILEAAEKRVALKGRGFSLAVTTFSSRVALATEGISA